MAAPGELTESPVAVEAVSIQNFAAVTKASRGAGDRWPARQTLDELGRQVLGAAQGQVGARERAGRRRWRPGDAGVAAAADRRSAR